jgi:hypothetical protein
MLIRVIKSLAPAGSSALRKGEKFNAPEAVANELIAAGVAVAAVAAATPAQKRERATRKATESR